MYPSSSYGWLLIRTMIASTLSILAMITHLRCIIREIQQVSPICQSINPTNSDTSYHVCDWL
jgi:hypothetical protein